MKTKLFDWILEKIYNWAMDVKGGEDATKTGIYYVQDWE